jgi:4-amino-4-deoxy-L-arabinose transferase-like glycosyltransferase
MPFPNTTAAPPSLLTCLPVVWSQVLFPGRADAEPRGRWTSWLLLLLLPGALLYPCLSFHLFEPDEARYAEIPREMLARGDWIVPYLQREPYLDKPPLFYWLVMLNYRLFGVQTWAARLIPAWAAHGCVLLTYWFGRRLLGERAAFWGALALGLCPGFMSMARLLLLDGLLALCVTLALFAAFEALRRERFRWGWWLVSAVACGLGILAKGPVAVVLLVVPLWLHRRLTGSSCRIGWPARLVFGGILALLVLPWYVAICVRMPEFARYFLWEHNVMRFVSPFDHQRPIWFYGPILLVGLLPASLLLWPFARFMLAREPNEIRLRCPELGFTLLAGGWCVLFFSLSGCKLPTYILPGFPPLALACGYFLSTRRWADSTGLRGGVALAWVVLAAVNYGFVPRYAEFHSPMSDPQNIVQCCGDRNVPVVCYPRSCDSVAFYLGRDDFRSYRSKDTQLLVQFLLQQPRTVILFTHRHSLEQLRDVLPPKLRILHEKALSGSIRRLDRAEMCYMAVVERR